MRDLHLPRPPAADFLDEEPLALPQPWTAPQRPAVPLLASAVPVVGSFALWTITGSIFTLWFALLGPLIAVATLLDGVRAARRGKGKAEKAAVAARAVAAGAIRERHDRERAALWARHPDVAAFVEQDEDVWRAVPGRAGVLVLGAGDCASAVRVTGGDGGPESIGMRERAAVLARAPVVVPATAGVAVLGPPLLAAAVVRALVAQLCLAMPPGELRVLPPAEEHSWATGLPHRRSSGGLALAAGGPDDPVSAEADFVVVRAAVGAARPPRCSAVLTVTAPGRGRLDYAGAVHDVAVEGLGVGQAEAIAARLAARAVAVLGEDAEAAGPVLLSSLLSRERSLRRDGGLAAAIGTEPGRDAVVDLVADGPHAVVAGVTGSGKSELLISWILSLCATHSTREVSFLLADFKGGTAFDGLAGVPHVTGVITDLDGSGARRAIESLRAEVRWREGELARAGARDILDPRVEMPRLVIVVDEFAALLGAHPELHAVFTDVAARGRALGMHLILGTQRIAGVVRDALLANCPLRLSLRVTDSADSRAVIGTDQAAFLPGGPEGRGCAFVRRAGDDAPRPVRIALSAPEDVRAAIERSVGPTPRRPWLPDLPTHVPLDAVRTDGDIVLGVIDEPEHQRQRPMRLSGSDRGLLIVGGAGSGKTTALRTIAAQATLLTWIPASPEAAWDAVVGLAEHPPPPGTVVIVDDLDTVAGRFPPDYAHVVLERIERLARGAGDAGVTVVASMQRPTGAASRIGELLPWRALLSMPTRAEYLAVGGDAGHHVPDAPPGRGRLDGRAIQFAIADAAQPISAKEPAIEWFPSVGITGYVGRRSAAVRAVLTAWQGAGVIVAPVDQAPHPLESAMTDGQRWVIVGDPDEWQRQWGLLGRVRAEHDLVIDASCESEYRLIAGERELPPYCAPGKQRAWLRRADGRPVRISLPSALGAEPDHLTSGQP